MMNDLLKLAKALKSLGFKKESQETKDLDAKSLRYFEDLKNSTSSNIKTMSIQKQTELAKRILKEADFSFPSNYVEVQRLISCITDCLDSAYNKASVHLFLLNPSIRSNQNLDREKIISASLVKASISYNENMVRVAKAIQKYFPQIGNRLLQSYNNMILAARGGHDIEASTGLPIDKSTVKSSVSDDKDADATADSMLKELELSLSRL